MKYDVFAHTVQYQLGHENETMETGCWPEAHGTRQSLGARREVSRVRLSTVSVAMDIDPEGMVMMQWGEGHKGTNCTWCVVNSTPDKVTAARRSCTPSASQPTVGAADIVTNTRPRKEKYDRCVVWRSVMDRVGSHCCPRKSERNKERDGDSPSTCEGFCMAGA